jgi:hypothetical protein
MGGSQDNIRSLELGILLLDGIELAVRKISDFPFFCLGSSKIK